MDIRALNYFRENSLWIRYWLRDGTEECMFSKILDWDDIGILLSGDGGSYDGSCWYPWYAIKQMQYFKIDAEELDEQM